MAESEVVVAAGSGQDASGALARTISVQTVINGVLTTVQMQVVTIADAQGNVISNFADYNMQRQLLAELRALRRMYSAITGIFDPVQSEDPSIGSVPQ